MRPVKSRPEDRVCFLPGRRKEQGPGYTGLLLSVEAVSSQISPDIYENILRTALIVQRIGKFQPGLTERQRHANPKTDAMRQVNTEIIHRIADIIKNSGTPEL